MTDDAAGGWIVDLGTMFLIYWCQYIPVNSAVKLRRFAKAEVAKKCWRYGESNAEPPHAMSYYPTISATGGEIVTFSRRVLSRLCLMAYTPYSSLFRHQLLP